MVSMIKAYTDCRILVGQNGIVWVQGENPARELLAVETIKKIEQEAHFVGLTDGIKNFLESHKDSIKEAQQRPISGEPHDI